MTQTLNGTAGADTLTGTDPGNPANPDGIDTINGLAGNDTLSGLGGDDIIQGGLGADAMDGGAGIDTLSYANATETVEVHLNDATADCGEAAGDTMSGFENLIGSAFSDGLRGDGGVNTVDGGAGDDVIQISGGADTLIGGSGVDILDSGPISSAVTINLTTGVVGGGAAGITFSGFEGWPVRRSTTS